MQTANLIALLRPLLELLAISALCSWTACLMIGLSLFSPGKAILVGLCGFVVGCTIWQVLNLPAGPWLSDFPLLPSLVGTLATAFGAQMVFEIRVAGIRFRIRGWRRQAETPCVLADEPAPAVESRPAEPSHDAAPAPSPVAR